MTLAFIVMSVFAMAEGVLIVALLNRLLHQSGIRQIDTPKLTKKTDDAPVVETRRKMFTLPIGS